MRNARLACCAIAVIAGLALPTGATASERVQRETVCVGEARWSFDPPLTTEYTQPYETSLSIDYVRNSARGVISPKDAWCVRGGAAADYYLSVIPLFADFDGAWIEDPSLFFRDLQTKYASYVVGDCLAASFLLDGHEWGGGQIIGSTAADVRWSYYADGLTNDVEEQHVFDGIEGAVPCVGGTVHSHYVRRTLSWK